MTIVRYNSETMEYELVDKLSGAVLEDGIEDKGAAEYLAHTYNRDED